MSSTIENLKKKIIYRSQYRGTKEMDKLLSGFVSKYINDFDLDQLNELEIFLGIDDENLYKFYNNLETDYHFKNNEINNLFKNFKLNKK
tara:strand:+ start:562 stop:828 length:267 start_codon:yes stop_codon:yes gene_type:complete